MSVDIELIPDPPATFEKPKPKVVEMELNPPITDTVERPADVKKDIVLRGGVAKDDRFDAIVVDSVDTPGLVLIAIKFANIACCNELSPGAKLRLDNPPRISFERLLTPVSIRSDDNILGTKLLKVESPKLTSRLLIVCEKPVDILLKETVVLIEESP